MEKLAKRVGTAAKKSETKSDSKGAKAEAKAQETKVRFNMIVTDRELALYKAAAAADSLTMSAWARLALRKLAGAPAR